VTNSLAWNSEESADGKTLYFTRWTEGGLWEKVLPDGEERRVSPLPRAGFWGALAVGPEGVFVIDTDTTPHPAIQFLDPRSYRQQHAIQTAGNPLSWSPGMTVSRDGKSLFYTRRESAAIIYLLENFD